MPSFRSPSLPRFLLPVSIASVLSVGCGGGSFQPDRFRHPSEPYAVVYPAAGSAVTPMGPAWKVANFTPRGNLKNAPAYVLERAYDLDEDGKVDLKETAPRYDLLFDHVNRDAAMWVRSVPIAPGDEHKDLSSLAERYLQAAADSGQVATPFGIEQEPRPAARRHYSPMLGTLVREPQTVVINTTAYVARALNSYACSVAHKPAHRIDFELAPAVAGQDPSQIRGTHGSVVLMRLRPLRADSYDRDPTRFPTLLLLGFSSSSTDAAMIDREFSHLLANVFLDDIKGSMADSQNPPCTAPPPPVEASGNESAPPSTPAPPAAAPALVSPQQTL